MTSDSSEAAAAAPARPSDSAGSGGEGGARAAAQAAGPAPVAPAAVDGGDARRTRGGAAPWVALAVAAVLAVGVAWLVQDRFGRIERELARRTQAAEVRDEQSARQLKLLGDTLRDTQARAALLEARLADTLGQQAQLKQLYDQMARSRGDLMLAEVEGAITIAAQQLQLGNNVQGALLALQDAEQALARSDQPATIGLRRVLARDVERLRAVPLSDFAAAVSRLDAVIAMIEQMPLLADLAPAVTTPASAPSGEPAAGLRGFSERVARTGLQGWEAFVAELRQLFRVQRADHPEALLLSPDQRFFARETLRLQLLNARLNLLARNEPLFRSDLARALSAIDRWFEREHRTVVAAQGALRQLQATKLAIDLPSLAESLGAVRAARAASEAR